MTDNPDIIVVGSGAGGAAVAYRLVNAGKRVLMIEKGGRLPRDGSTLDTKKVFKEGLFKNREMWVDGQNKSFTPGEFYNVGGKTKWYGAALLRYGPHEFEPDDDHQCLGWPIGYDQIAPYYDEAEALLDVNHFDNEAELQRLIDRVVENGSGWRAEPLPLGLKREILNHEEEAKHFDGFASACGFKSDAEWNLLNAIEGSPNFTLVADNPVVGLIYVDGQPTQIAGVRCANGDAYHAANVVLSAGAMSSPRLLQDHITATGIADDLPCADVVGAYFKFHINSAVLAFSPFTHHDVLRKTAILFNDAYPHSTVQCLGWIDGDIMGSQLPAAVPKFVTNAMAARAYGFFVTTEDGSVSDNRIVSNGAAVPPMMDYDLRRLKPAQKEHGKVIRAFMGRLLKAGLAGVDKYMGLAGTAHALGSMVTGTDPKTTVVDADGKVHGMEGLYVSDGSVLPRSSRVNPALTIYAWGLRLGDHLARPGA